MKFRPTEFLNTPYRVSCYIRLYRKLFSGMRPVVYMAQAGSTMLDVNVASWVFISRLSIIILTLIHIVNNKNLIEVSFPYRV